MRLFGDIVGSLIPSDETDPKSVRIYRIRMALVACSAWLTVSLVIIPALFVGLPLLGRVAWSEEMESKMAQVVMPVQRELAELKREIQAQTIATNAALAEMIYQEIMRLARQRCATSDPNERDRLRALIHARVLRYQALAGDPTFTTPACTDL